MEDCHGDAAIVLEEIVYLVVDGVVSNGAVPTAFLCPGPHVFKKKVQVLGVPGELVW